MQVIRRHRPCHYRGDGERRTFACRMGLLTGAAIHWVGAALILMDHLDDTSTWQYTPTSRMLEIASSVLQAIVGA